MRGAFFANCGFQMQKNLIRKAGIQEMGTTQQQRSPRRATDFKAATAFQSSKVTGSFHYLVIMGEKVGGIMVDGDCTRLAQH
jgi:hypothetical protein